METDKAWKFFDFDKNWEPFYTLWKSEKIQQSLSYYINSFIADCYDDTPKERPTWKKNDPLWSICTSQYWVDKLCEKVELYIDEHDLMTKYKKRMEQIQCRKFPSDIDTIIALWDSFYSSCYDILIKEVEPKPHTLESLVLVDGKNYISYVLYEIAKQLFPNDDVIVTHYKCHCDMILVVQKKIVFDLLGFYFYTREKETTACGSYTLHDDDVYEEIVRKFFAGEDSLASESESTNGESVSESDDSFFEDEDEDDSYDGDSDMGLRHIV